MNDGKCPGKAARTRRRRLTGTGFTRLESRLWGLGICGGGCIDPRGLSGTRHYYTMPNGKVKRPRTIFFVFFVGRSDGLWRTAFGLRGSAAKKSPRHRQTFARTPTAGGEIAPSSWVTNPRARTFAPWWDWRTHNIHHVIMMSSEHERKSRRLHGALRTGLRASGSACHRTFLTAFPGRLAALRSILLHNKYLALSSFARH